MGRRSKVTAFAALSADDRERVKLLMAALHEFHEGFICWRQLSGRIPQAGPLDRYFIHAHTHYLHSFYHDNTTNGLLPLIRHIGLGSYANGVERILQRPIGSTSLRNIIIEWRNKWLAHTAYTWERVEAAIFSVYDPSDPSQLNAFGLAQHQLVKRTICLHSLLRSLYPELSTFLDRHYSGHPGK